MKRMTIDIKEGFLTEQSYTEAMHKTPAETELERKINALDNEIEKLEQERDALVQELFKLRGQTAEKHVTENKKGEIENGR